MPFLLPLYITFVSLVFLGLIALDARHYLRPKSAAVESPRYRPNVLVAIPCKGMDIGLVDNLSSIMKQDYPRYKAVAIVDSAGDKAMPAIKKAGIDCLISRKISRMASGKVNALLTAFQKYNRYDVYVIADSDILVDGKWLETLVAPLANKEYGLSTMFPYFKPVGGFWSKVKLVWGFVGEGLLEDEGTRFGWGGSLAFRKETMPAFVALARDSAYSVSDDICVTKAVESQGLRMAYSKKSQPIVKADDNFERFIEWANRQTAFALMGYRKTLYYGIAFYTAEILVFLSGIALSVLVSPLFILLFAHLASSVVKTYRRAGNRDPALLPIIIAAPFIYLSNLLAAARMRSVVWRGTRYKVGA